MDKKNLSERDGFGCSAQNEGMEVDMIQRVDLNRAWEFTCRFDDSFLAGEAAPDTETVELPHTAREIPYNYLDEGSYQMICGYRRRLSVPRAWRDKRVFLHVGAAGHSAEVYVDGEKLGEHHCGYTEFQVELTHALTPGGEALLTIKVDSREGQDIPPFGYVIDYLTYGGLYREVWLEIKEQRYIGDVFVKPAIPEGEGLLTGTETADEIAALRFAGTLQSRVTVCGGTDGLCLRQWVTACPGGEALAEKTIPLSGETTATDLTLTVPGVGLWDVKSPGRYAVTTQLLTGETVLDSVRTVVGFRRAEFRTDGFYLNGRKFRLVGLNRHQSYPYVGYAMPKSMQRLDADILKYELGLNAVRTSHYPQSHHFIDRCDELGLLVFTEIPGWQHIGGEQWKKQAIQNTEDMVCQYRNHPSIILWGVRINESVDDDALYIRTNAAAHRLDPTRPTGGVRCHKKSSLLEDVYTYNDFVHEGTNKGCEPKKAVTSDPGKPYLISEYGGHMYPTKSYDSEEHRLEHALRHANVLNAVAGEEDIAGSFGWCMFDYNTHKDFGSGDRICYHGVMDMFRNPKLAADVYASQGREDVVLSISSTMEAGEHPATNRGRIFVFTNADSVRMYKNDCFIREYTHENSPYPNLPQPPIELDDFIGDQIEKNEPFSPAQAEAVKELLNYNSRFGASHLPLPLKRKAAWLMLRYRMNYGDLYRLFGKYVGNWGDAATVYRFEAVKDGKVVKTVRKTPAAQVHLSARADHTELREERTYDAALIRMAMRDQNGNVLPFYQEPVELETEGPIAVIGPKVTLLRGGMGGTYVKTVGKSGRAVLKIRAGQAEPVQIVFQVTGEA